MNALLSALKGPAAKKAYREIGKGAAAAVGWALAEGGMELTKKGAKNMKEWNAERKKKAEAKKAEKEKNKKKEEKAA